MEKSNVKDIFQTMEYGQELENTDKAINWFEAKGKVFFAYEAKPTETPVGEPIVIKNAINSENLCTVYENTDSKTWKKVKERKVKWSDTKALDRVQIINKLADEIESNADLISQIEICTRGILARDTKKQIKLLIEYLRYYSGFAVRLNNENPTWTPNGIVQAYVTQKIGLAVIGAILGPALAAGYNVALFGEPLIVPIVTFLLDLAQKVGISDSVLRIVPDRVHLYYVRVFAVEDAQIRVVQSNKIPFIVFDNADLEAACDAVIEATWSHQGTLPETVDTLLVQENIFDSFVEKLKNKIRKLKFGKANDKLVDYPCLINEESIDILNNDVKKAKELGIEVFQPNPESTKFQPTLFIGAKVHTNDVIDRENTNESSNAMTVLSFRSIDEAVSLANNSRQGLYASVWTENISLANEVHRKLKVCNVWINTHGVFSVDVPSKSLKDKYTGYFGGEEGFYNYLVKDIEDLFPRSVNSKTTKLMSASRKAQEAWQKVSKLNKINVFHKIVECMVEIPKRYKSLNIELSPELVENMHQIIYNTITQNRQNPTVNLAGVNLNSYREPAGVVVIDGNEGCHKNVNKFLIEALFYGNSVILFTKHTNFYSEFNTFLPKDLLTVLPKKPETPQTFASYDATFVDKTVLDIQTEADVFRKVTTVKNVWSAVGQSHQCNL